MRALASLIALTCALYTRYGFPSGNVLPGLDRASSLHIVSSNSTLTRPTPDFLGMLSGCPARTRSRPSEAVRLGIAQQAT